MFDTKKKLLSNFIVFVLFRVEQVLERINVAMSFFQDGSAQSTVYITRRTMMIGVGSWH